MDVRLMAPEFFPGPFLVQGLGLFG